VIGVNIVNMFTLNIHRIEYDQILTNVNRMSKLVLLP